MFRNRKPCCHVDLAWRVTVWWREVDKYLGGFDAGNRVWRQVPRFARVVRHGLELPSGPLDPSGEE